MCVGAGVCLGLSGLQLSPGLGEGCVCGVCLYVLGVIGSAAKPCPSRGV